MAEPNLGVFYGVGMGPGDPELVTCKALRLIRKTRVIALAARSAETSMAWRIACGAMPELQAQLENKQVEKKLLFVSMPMLTDTAVLRDAHRAAAEQIEAVLDRGEDVVFLTIGDPTVYSSAGYLLSELCADGYTAQLVPGVPSFCAAAARVQMPLALGRERLCVFPDGAVQGADPEASWVLLKSGRHMRETAQQLSQLGRQVYGVANCEQASEQVFLSPAEMPEDAGYMSLLLSPPPERSGAKK